MRHILYNVHTYTWWKRNAEIASDRGNKVCIKQAWTNKHSQKWRERSQTWRRLHRPQQGLAACCSWSGCSSPADHPPAGRVPDFPVAAWAGPGTPRPWPALPAPSPPRDPPPTPHCKGKEKKERWLSSLPREKRAVHALHKVDLVRRQKMDYHFPQLAEGSKSHLGGVRKLRNFLLPGRKVKSLSILAGILTKHQQGHQLPSHANTKQP